MGFIDGRAATAIAPPLTPGDYLRLVTLGLAERGPIAPDGVTEAAAALAGPLWSPVGQLAEDAVADLIAEGCLALAADGATALLTERGRRRLMEALQRPIAAPLTAFGEAGTRVKLAFLHLLPPGPRHRQLTALIRSYECAIATRCRAWPVAGPLGRQWLDHALEQLEEGLALLRRMAAETSA